MKGRRNFEELPFIEILMSHGTAFSKGACLCLLGDARKLSIMLKY
jgi:hypothetical protein